MTAPALMLVNLCYAATAWDFYCKGQHGMCVVFVGYILANLGFIWAAWR